MMNDERRMMNERQNVSYSSFIIHPFPRGSGLSPRFDLSFGNSIDLPPDLRALVASRICLFFLSVRWPSFFCRVFSDILPLLLARSLKSQPLHSMIEHAPATPATLRACKREAAPINLYLVMLRTTRRTARAQTPRRPSL